MEKRMTFEVFTRDAFGACCSFAVVNFMLKLRLFNLIQDKNTPFFNWKLDSRMGNHGGGFYL